MSGNTASSFGGILLTFGKMDISHSTITGNTAGSGGGIGVNGGELTISDSNISDNVGASTQGGQGGGISNAGTVKLVRSLVSGNTGAQGGGIANTGTGTILVLNSTVDGNTSQSGGGIFNQSTAGSASATIINSTISHNHANGAPNNNQGFGGGIFYPKGVTSIMNTIIAGNAAPNAAPEDVECSAGTSGSYTGGQLQSEGHNLDSNGSCLTPGTNKNIVIKGTGDQSSTDPLFSSSGPDYNGGPSKTVMVSAGSPAIDAVPTLDCTDQNGQSLAKDQRNFSRPVNGACDVGAVEVQQSAGTPADLSVHSTVAPSPVNPNGTLTYTVTIRDNGPNNASGVTLTDNSRPAHPSSRERLHAHQHHQRRGTDHQLQCRRDQCGQRRAGDHYRQGGGQRHGNAHQSGQRQRQRDGSQLRQRQ